MSPATVDDSLHSEVCRLLQKRYGLEAELTRLPGENLNYLLCGSGGERHVLKIASAECGNETIEMEHAAIECVASADIGLRVPRTVKTAGGSVIAELEIEGSEPLRAQLLEYVNGTPWCELPGHSAALCHDLGAKLARLDKILAEFKHPAMARTHRWDLVRLDAQRADIALVDEPQRRHMAEWAFQLWTAYARPAFGTLPWSFIHGDANDENLLVGGERVVGLLDFGDSLYNPVVCELAICLAYIMLDNPDPLAAAATVIGGYREQRSLSERELKILFPLICGRLATTVTVAAERRRIEPEHPNWFVTEERAWRLLDKLFGTDPASAHARFSTASGTLWS